MAHQRNLIFFIYPRHEGQKWRHAVQHLKARWGQFDGRKVVAVSVDTSCDSMSEVIDEFGDPSIDFHCCHNTALQEVQPFGTLLESIRYEPGITLYAHAKGCTHKADDAASHPWCDAMAAACLDYPALIDCMLTDGLTCGAFRSIQRIGWSGTPWHFAGTWFWFRNADLFSRNWGDFEQVFWGVESYPGKHFAHHESRCLFFDSAETAHLYSPDWWRVHIGPAFRAWKRRLLNRCGLSPICSDPPLSLLGREVLV